MEDKKTTTRVKKTTETQELDLTNELAKKDAEISAMKDMMLQLQMQMQQMMLSSNQTQTTQAPQEEFINIYKAIPVMSLFDGMLNLSTQPNGQGKSYTFNRFGEVRNIVYSDLRDIIGSNFSFAKEGLFYVMDEKIVFENGLTEYYEKMLNKEAIENIIETDKENILNIFDSAPKSQKETIVDIIVGKMAKGESFDLNKVSIISDKIGKDINTMVKDLKFSLGDKL